MFTKAAFIWLKNTEKQLILWNIITILNNCYLFEYIVKCNLFLQCQSRIFCIITHAIQIILAEYKPSFYSDLKPSKSSVHQIIYTYIINKPGAQMKTMKVSKTFICSSVFLYL